MARSEGSRDLPMVSSSSNDGEQNAHQQQPADPEQSQANKESLLVAFAKSNGYPLVQQNGQRRYGPPCDWKNPPPQKGCEVFVGKLPRDVMEYELVPIFERVGKIYEMRMMMDFNGSNRGYAFVTYCTKQQAKKACQELNGYEIRRGRYIGVLKSVDNCRLYVSGIPRDKARDDVLTEMSRLTDGVVDVILYPSAADKSKNRGFAFVEYESHRCAAMARRKLAPNRLTLWGSEITVDWAEPERDVDEETMAQVKKLYIRNLMIHTTEEFIRQTVENISGSGTVERVKKIRDYAFVHFSRREDAIKVQEMLNNSNLDGSVVEVKLAKPPDRSIMRFVKNAQKLAAQLYSASININGRDNGPEVTSGSKAVPLLSCPETGQSANASVYMGFPCIDPFAMGPTLPAGVALPNIRGTSGGGTGRFVGRGAAGMRAASFQAMLNSTFRRHRFHYADVLEEYCKQNNWGAPRYRLQTTTNGDADDTAKLYSYNVEIPSLLATCGMFHADQPLPDKQDAREVAAEYTLNQLGVVTSRQRGESGQYEDTAGITVPAATIRSPSGDSGISAGSMSSTKVTTVYDAQSQQPYAPVPLCSGPYSTAAVGFPAAAYENFVLPDMGAFQPLLFHAAPFGTSSPTAVPAGAWVPSYVGIYNGLYAETAPCFGPAFSAPPPQAIYVNYDTNPAGPQPLPPPHGCISAG